MYRGHYSYSMPKAYPAPEVSKKFPEDIECIIKSKDPTSGSLYISNIEAAQNLDTIKKHQIGAILTCAKGYHLSHSPSEVPHYKYLPLVDHDQCDISLHLNDAVDFIKEKIAKTNILVHCIAGVSRSVSMVIAYLIREHRMTYQEAYSLVKSKRKIICPNDGFIKQLKEFHRQRSVTQTSFSPKVVNSKNITPNRNYTPVKENSERTNYLGNDFKSTELTPNSQPSKIDQIIQRYKSTLLTPKTIGDESQKFGRKEEANIFYRTTSSFFTPHKNQSAGYHDYTLKAPGDKTISYSRYTPKSQKIINIDQEHPKNDLKSVTPNKQMLHKPQYEPPTQTHSNRKGYFQEMNKQINEKINLIRRKYDKQREKLMEKYQFSQKIDRKKHTLDYFKMQEKAVAPSLETYYYGKRNAYLVDKPLHSEKKPANDTKQKTNLQYLQVKEYFNQVQQSKSNQFDDLYLKIKERQKEEENRKEKQQYRKYNYDASKIDSFGQRYRPYLYYESRSPVYKDYQGDRYSYNYKRF